MILILMLPGKWSRQAAFLRAPPDVSRTGRTCSCPVETYWDCGAHFLSFYS